MRAPLAAAVALAVTLPALAPAGGAVWPSYGADPWRGAPGGDVDPKVDVVIAPLASQPTILEAGTPLRVEVAPGTVDLDGVDAWLTPSFGAAERRVLLELARVEAGVDSHLWPDRPATALVFEPIEPDPAKGVVEGLYDLHVQWGASPGQRDAQPRAVDLVEAFPERPRVAVVADPSVGDPRPVQEGLEASLDGRDPGPALARALATAGHPARHEGRWAAFQATIEAVNLLDPDLVLVPGDLTFGLYPRALPYEYEDAYTLVNEVEAPTFLVPGNHDLYAVHDEPSPYVHDGKQLWTDYFGPLHWTAALPGGLHLVGLDTYDHAKDHRTPLDPERDSPSGGQVGDDQRAWLAAELDRIHRSDPDARVLTFGHHDPSWSNGSHPWVGDDKLALRDLLAEAGVAAHFAGHKHNDRVARYHEGHVVETNGQAGGEPGRLHYVRRDDTLDPAPSQATLAGILHAPQHGPLFVTTTTAASALTGSTWGQGGWWGFRYGALNWTGAGLDPAPLGYPATEAFLEEHAERPERWNASHAAHGLFSYPTFRLNETLDGPNDGSRRSVTANLESDLLTPERVVVRLAVDAGEPEDVEVTGGEVLKARSDGDATDVWVEARLDAGEARAVTARATGDVASPRLSLP